MDTKTLLSASPVLYDNFLSEEIVDTIYKIIDTVLEDGKLENNKYKNFSIQSNGMHRFNFVGNDGEYAAEPLMTFDLFTMITKKITDTIGKEVENVGGYFARYSLESSTIPSLLPHTDKANIGETYKMAFTSRLRSNIEWDIGVETTRWHLKENSALFFSPNLYSHWRPKKIFNRKDYYDILVCHFNFKNTDPWFINEEYFLNQEKILTNKELIQFYEKEKQ